MTPRAGRTPPARLRFLDADDLPAIHAAFLAAFADYPIPKRPTFDQLAMMMVRRGARLDLSVGAFDGDRMIGVMATGSGTWRGRPAAYDVFTGVVPAWRGRGLAGALFDHALPELRALGTEIFVLEVLTGNEAAVRAYRRAGFAVARDLVCLEIDPGGPSPPPPRGRIEIRRADRPDLDAWRSFRSWEPSWQNADATIGRAIGEAILLEAFDAEERIGCAALLPDTAELLQIAVAPSRRRRGLGTALLAESRRELGERRAMRILNVDAAAHGDLAFWRARGAREFTRQHEMTFLLA